MPGNNENEEVLYLNFAPVLVQHGRKDPFDVSARQTEKEREKERVQKYRNLQEARTFACSLASTATRVLSSGFVNRTRIF